MSSLVDVSISVTSKVEVTDELKKIIKEKYPYVDCQTDEDYAIVALFAASDNCLPKFLSWEGNKMELSY